MTVLFPDKYTDETQMAGRKTARGAMKQNRAGTGSSLRARAARRATNRAVEGQHARKTGGQEKDAAGKNRPDYIGDK